MFGNKIDDALPDGVDDWIFKDKDGLRWVPSEISAADTRDKFIGVAPPENGTQFGVVEIPPLNPAHPSQPLWHRTRTVDYVVVMSGEIDLVLENSVVHLKAGDTVVQQATNHVWVNRGTEVCRLLFVLLDAKRPKG